MKSSRWMLVLACLALFGCATAGGTQAGPVDVTGTWEGTFTWPYGVSPIRLDLRQDGTKVNGQITTESTVGELRQGNGPVEGSVSGDAVALTFAGGSANLFVRGASMNGFSSSGSSWTLQRR